MLALHQATGEFRWLEVARRLAEGTMRFFDPAEGRFYDSLEATPLGRPAEPVDGAYPSGSALAVELLLRLGVVYGEADWERAAEAVLERMVPTMARGPLGFGGHLGAHLFALEGSELAVSRPAELEGYVRGIFAPLTVTHAFYPNARITE